MRSFTPHSSYTLIYPLDIKKDDECKPNVKLSRVSGYCEIAIQVRMKHSRNPKNQHGLKDGLETLCSSSKSSHLPHEEYFPTGYE
jgi:hypothetical protein